MLGHRTVRLRRPSHGGPIARRRAILLLEVVASLGLTVTLAVLATAAIVQYAGVRRETDARRLLQLAAAAELDRIRAGVVAIPWGASEPPPAAQPGEVAVHATATPGAGLWQGLVRVRVVARQCLGPRRTITVELTTFVEGGPQP